MMPRRTITTAALALAFALMASTDATAQQKVARNAQGFGQGKGSNANNNNNNANQKADLKLQKVAFDRRDREFELTFKNFGNAATKAKTVVVTVGKTRLTVQVPVIAPGQTKVVRVKITRDGLLDAVKDAIRRAGKRIRDFIEDFRIKIDIDIDIEVSFDGQKLKRSVKIGD